MKTTTTATVLRAHAGGHLVHCDVPDIDLLCALRGRLKKERVSVVTGDRVEISEVDTVERTGVIEKRHDRVNQLSRPVIANIDTPVVVQAVHQPEWNPELCDRYLVHVQLELPGVMPIICINKCDLAAKGEEDRIRKIYEPLGYVVYFISASTGDGIEHFARALSGKISVLIGPSGVGKSSIINLLDPGLGLRTGVMEHDFGVGRSTTTYSTLYPVKIEKFTRSQQSRKFEKSEKAEKSEKPTKASRVGDKDKASWVADTPGFSLSELHHGKPAQLKFQFSEIARLGDKCKYADCLHVGDHDSHVQECNVLKNLKRIAETRYRSYTAMIAESIKQYKLQRASSSKTEQHVKIVGGKKSVPRLERKYRVESRRKLKQTLAGVPVEEDENY